MATFRWNWNIFVVIYWIGSSNSSPLRLDGRKFCQETGPFAENCIFFSLVQSNLSPSREGESLLHRQTCQLVVQTNQHEKRSHLSKITPKRPFAKDTSRLASKHARSYIYSSGSMSVPINESLKGVFQLFKISSLSCFNSGGVWFMYVR